MKLLCRKYVRFLIALLMISALQGKFIISTTADLVASKFIDVADSNELPTPDTETEDTAAKVQKKNCGDTESEIMLLFMDACSGMWSGLSDPDGCKDLLHLYEKVPTQPPLLQIA